MYDIDEPYFTATKALRHLTSHAGNCTDRVVGELASLAQPVEVPLGSGGIPFVECVWSAPDTVNLLCGTRTRGRSTTAHLRVWCSIDAHGMWLDTITDGHLAPGSAMPNDVVEAAEIAARNIVITRVLREATKHPCDVSLIAASTALRNFSIKRRVAGVAPQQRVS